MASRVRCCTVGFVIEIGQRGYVQSKQMLKKECLPLAGISDILCYVSWDVELLGLRREVPGKSTYISSKSTFLQVSPKITALQAWFPNNTGWSSAFFSIVVYTEYKVSVKKMNRTMSFNTRGMRLSVRCDGATIPSSTSAMDLFRPR